MTKAPPFPQTIDGIPTAGMADPRVLLRVDGRPQKPGANAPWISNYYAPITTISRQTCKEMFPRGK